MRHTCLDSDRLAKQAIDWMSANFKQKPEDQERTGRAPSGLLNITGLICEDFYDITEDHGAAMLSNMLQEHGQIKYKVSILKPT